MAVDNANKSGTRETPRLVSTVVDRQQVRLLPLSNPAKQEVVQDHSSASKMIRTVARQS